MTRHKVYVVAEKGKPLDINKVYFDKKFFTDENSAQWAARRWNSPASWDANHTLVEVFCVHIETDTI